MARHNKHNKEWGFYLAIQFRRLQIKTETFNIAVYGKIKPKANQAIPNVSMGIKFIQACHW